jgi:CYTH domain-containing protein
MMGTEIERKFLVKPGLWIPESGGVIIRQGYLSSVPSRVVRVRVADNDAFLTVKGVQTKLSRIEYEYPIPRSDAEVLLNELCERPLVEKTRRRQRVGDKIWEIDVFHGENEGLILAEIELRSEDEAFELPSWTGDEVSNDPRYFNANLARNPFRNWAST